MEDPFSCRVQLWRKKKCCSHGSGVTVALWRWTPWKHHLQCFPFLPLPLTVIDLPPHPVSSCCADSHLTPPHFSHPIQWWKRQSETKLVLWWASQSLVILVCLLRFRFQSTFRKNGERLKEREKLGNYASVTSKLFRPRCWIESCWCRPSSTTDPLHTLLYYLPDMPAGDPPLHCLGIPPPP